MGRYIYGYCPREGVSRRLLIVKVIGLGKRRRIIFSRSGGHVRAIKEVGAIDTESNLNSPTHSSISRIALIGDSETTSNNYVTRRNKHITQRFFPSKQNKMVHKDNLVIYDELSQVDTNFSRSKYIVQCTVCGNKFVIYKISKAGKKNNVRIKRTDR